MTARPFVADLLAYATAQAAELATLEAEGAALTAKLARLEDERDVLAAQVAQLETATARRSILNPDALRARAELADVLAGAVLVLTDTRDGDAFTVTAEAIHRRGGADALEVLFEPAVERYTIRPKAPRPDANGRAPLGPCVKCAADPPIGHQEPHRDALGRLTR